MHAPDNYNAQDHHRPSEAVVQSCPFVPLANLLRVMDMNEAGFASSSLQFPIVSNEPRGPQPEDIQ